MKMKIKIVEVSQTWKCISNISGCWAMSAVSTTMRTPTLQVRPLNLHYFKSSSKSLTTPCTCVQEWCGCPKVDDCICESWLEAELMEVAPDKYPPVKYIANIMKSLNFKGKSFYFWTWSWATESLKRSRKVLKIKTNPEKFLFSHWSACQPKMSKAAIEYDITTVKFYYWVAA